VGIWRQPDNDSLLHLAKIFNTSTDFLLGNVEERYTSPKGVKVPVLGYIRAGIPLDAVEEILDYEEVDPAMAAKGDLFALRVKGDSMERIREGDVIICAETPCVESGTVAVVLVNGNEATVKKVVKHKEGLSLVAFNPAYSPMFYTNEECETLPVRIVGRVIELRGKF
jgi:repressor LexA